MLKTLAGCDISSIWMVTNEYASSNVTLRHATHIYEAESDSNQPT